MALADRHHQQLHDLSDGEDDGDEDDEDDEDDLSRSPTPPGSPGAVSRRPANRRYIVISDDEDESDEEGIDVEDGLGNRDEDEVEPIDQEYERRVREEEALVRERDMYGDGQFLERDQPIADAPPFAGDGPDEEDDGSDAGSEGWAPLPSLPG